MSELNYEHVFDVLVDKTAEYVTENNLKAMVLGISGGIDSTVVAAICHEVSKKTGIPLIGRSLPIKNKSDEFDVSKLVGEAFCDEFKVFNLSSSYKSVLFDLCADTGLIKDCKGYDWYWVSDLEELAGRTPIANGNIQARCRMIHLYDIASIRKGLVMSTDNQTEYQLGFWTIHGDVGDFDPKCVEIVNRIVKETGCKVVVSSSWRAEINLQSIFDKAGLKFKIHSITPFGDHRGCEIRDWLASETEPYVYAILDDDRSMLAEQRKYFIKTNTVTGITDEDARHVINILNRNDMWNDKLNSLIMESMKNHDAVRTTVLRAIKTEFSNYATAKNAKPLDNAAEVAIIKKLRDQRIDNAEQYRMAGRQDLYDNEMAESLILNEFLPEVPDDKVLALGLVEVCALQGCEDGPKIPKSKMGIIIKELKAMFPAADGKQIADLVKSCVV